MIGNTETVAQLLLTVKHRKKQRAQISIMYRK
jgi:hypothetical protein